jgi:hypothetical protein
MQFRVQSAIALLFLVSVQPAIAVPKMTTEAVIDQVFRSSALLPGEKPEGRQELEKIKAGAIQWLGNYQGVRSEKGRSIIVFERGTVPVEVQFRANGEPDSIGTQCPVTSVPLSQAPKEFQEALSECSNLKR